MLVMALPLPAATPAAPALDLALRFEVFDPVTGLAAYLGLRRDQGEPEVRRRLGRGDRCFVGWLGERIVTAVWVATERAYVPYLRRDLVLRPGDAYEYDLFTAPELRGRGLVAAHTAVIRARIAAAGARRCLALVAVENRASRALLARNGWRAIGRVGVLRLGALQRLSCQALGSEPLPGFAAPSRRAGSRSR